MTSDNNVVRRQAGFELQPISNSRWLDISCVIPTRRLKDDDYGTRVGFIILIPDQRREARISRLRDKARKDFFRKLIQLYAGSLCS